MLFRTCSQLNPNRRAIGNALRVAALVVVVAVALGVSLTQTPEAFAQEVRQLVGNYDASRDGVFTLRGVLRGIGQEFQTGGQRGFKLSSVVVPIKDGHESRYMDLEGAIYSVNSNGSRGSKLAVLSDNGVFTNHADFRFEDPNRTELEPSTRYMFVIDCLEGCVNDNRLEFSRTRENSEDGDGENSWSIADKAVRESDGWARVGSNDSSMRMSVRGTGGHPYVETDGIQVVSTPATSNAYGNFETVRVTVSFNRAVRVDTTGGTPRLAFSLGDTQNPGRTEYMDYAKGSGGRDLVFEYVVQPGDRDANGIYVHSNVIRLNGGTIERVSNDRGPILTHPVVGTLAQVKIDGSLNAPFTSLTDLELSGATLDPGFSPETTEYAANVGSGVGTTTVSAIPTTGGSVSIEPEDADAFLPGHQVALDDGDNVIRIVASLPDHIAMPYAVDIYREPRDVPVVTDITVITTPLSTEYYGRDERIEFAVHFDHPVAVDLTGSRPVLRVDLFLSEQKNRRLEFEYARGSGTNRLVFQHRVKSDEYYAGSPGPHMRIPENRLRAGGGISHAENGRPADLSHPDFGRVPGQFVNGRRDPAVAKLEDISLTGVTIRPQFRSTITLYKGRPDHGVNVTTVTATPKGDGSRRIITPDSDTSTPGRQVALHTGLNEISIEARDDASAS